MTKQEIIAATKEQLAGIGIVEDQRVVYDWTPGCTYSVQQKGDIEASQIKSKWATAVPVFLDHCEQLRKDNPEWSDETIRSVAKASV